MRLDGRDFDAVRQHMCARALADHAHGTDDSRKAHGEATLVVTTLGIINVTFDRDID
jgi:hypothetical protein